MTPCIEASIFNRRKITLGNRRLIRRPGAAGKSAEDNAESAAVTLAKSQPYAVAKNMVCTVCAREPIQYRKKYILA